MQTFAQCWVGEGRSQGVSAYTKGHYVTITMELHGQIVVKYCSSRKKGDCDPGCGKRMPGQQC